MGIVFFSLDQEEERWSGNQERVLISATLEVRVHISSPPSSAFCFCAIAVQCSTAVPSAWPGNSTMVDFQVDHCLIANEYTHFKNKYINDIARLYLHPERESVENLVD